VYDSKGYKEYSYKNMFDNNYLDSAAFKKYLEVTRLVHEEFLKAIGVVK
jgi:tripartite-type tricarboxylate transporter receptor subunit TctC